MAREDPDDVEYKKTLCVRWYQTRVLSEYKFSWV